jgi:hypothetical protein
MNINDLLNMTASCTSGAAGEKALHKILRVDNGNYGPEIVIDVTALNAAMQAGCYRFTGKRGEKDGHVMVPLRPKFHPKKEETLAGEVPKSTAVDLAVKQDDIDDTIPF